MVNVLKDFCIVRTRFYNPYKLKFDSYATDSYTSSVSLDYLVRALKVLVYSDYIGTINVGGEKAI